MKTASGEQFRALLTICKQCFGILGHYRLICYAIWGGTKNPYLTGPIYERQLFSKIESRSINVLYRLHLRLISIINVSCTSVCPSESQPVLNQLDFNQNMRSYSLLPDPKLKEFGQSVFSDTRVFSMFM